MSRSYTVKVRFTEEELKQVDGAVGRLAGSRSGVVREAALRQLRSPATVPTRDEVLGQLAAAAQEGSIAAMLGLARELRLGGEPQVPVKPGRVRLEDIPPGGLRVVR